MFKKTPIAALLAATTSIAVFVGGCAAQAEKPAATPAAPSKPDYTKMTPEALAEYIIMESGSFDLA